MYARDVRVKCDKNDLMRLTNHFVKETFPTHKDTVNNLYLLFLGAMGEAARRLIAVAISILPWGAGRARGQGQRGV